MSGSPSHDDRAYDEAWGPGAAEARRRAGGEPERPVVIEPFDEPNWFEEWSEQDDDQDPDEQDACAKCLKPAGRVPILLFKTVGDETKDMWAYCNDCFQKMLASGEVKLHAS